MLDVYELTRHSHVDVDSHAHWSLNPQQHCCIGHAHECWSVIRKYLCNKHTCIHQRICRDYGRHYLVTSKRNNPAAFGVFFDVMACKSTLTVTGKLQASVLLLASHVSDLYLRQHGIHGPLQLRMDATKCHGVLFLACQTTSWMLCWSNKCIFCCVCSWPWLIVCAHALKGCMLRSCSRTNAG